jgi:Ca2+-binding EF-hand superfamily protein
MPVLIQFFEQNGYYAKTEEMEAILRRCDHDGDRFIGFDEFCEVTGLP